MPGGIDERAERAATVQRHPHANKTDRRPRERRRGACPTPQAPLEPPCASRSPTPAASPRRVVLASRIHRRAAVSQGGVCAHNNTRCRHGARARGASGLGRPGQHGGLPVAAGAGPPARPDWHTCRCWRAPRRGRCGAGGGQQGRVGGRGTSPHHGRLAGSPWPLHHGGPIMMMVRCVVTLEAGRPSTVRRILRWGPRHVISTGHDDLFFQTYLQLKFMCLTSFGARAASGGGASCALDSCQLVQLMIPTWRATFRQGSSSLLP